jgi:hypothetical protein
MRRFRSHCGRAVASRPVADSTMTTIWSATLVYSTTLKLCLEDGGKGYEEGAVTVGKPHQDASKTSRSLKRAFA